MSGWIKVHRSILEWEWYSDVNARLLFLHLLLTVNYTEGKWQGRIIKRGQRVTSLPKLAEETGLSIRQTRTALDKLKLTGELTDKNFNKGRIITIVNYHKYQEDDRQADSQMTGKRQTNGQTNDSNIRNKEINKERKKEVKKDNNAQQVREIFEYWVDVFGKNGATKLTADRAQKVRARLNEGYTVEQIQCAILGCSKDAWHVEKGVHDLEYICRKGSNVERLMSSNQPTKPKSQALDDWANGTDTGSVFSPALRVIGDH